MRLIHFTILHSHTEMHKFILNTAHLFALASEKQLKYIKIYQKYQVLRTAHAHQQVRAHLFGLNEPYTQVIELCD